MHSIVRATLIALVPTVGGVAVGRQQAAMKIAYVNTTALMEAAPGRDSATAILNREGNAFQAQLQKLQDSVNARLAKFNKAEPTLTPAAKDKETKEIQVLEQDLQTKNQQFQQQFDQRKQEVLAPITDMVKKVLDDLREEGNYSMIFMNDPGQTPIVSADKNLDITDKAISRLRATKAPTIPAASALKGGAPSAPAGVTKPPKPPTQ
jgi:outer membrane protein